MSSPDRSYRGPLDLSESEVRVLGCLLEKQRTTPDVYPLTLNALRLACNQLTNRDPVLDYGEDVVRDALHKLERRGFVRLASGAGSRAQKYRHLLAEAMPLSGAEQAVIAVLMLRGPQTPGELKQRTDRSFRFADLNEVARTLQSLIERGLIQRLERRPGHKEERFAQLLSRDARGEDAAPADRNHDAGFDGARSYVAERAPADSFAELEERVARLELEVAQLRAERSEARLS